MRIPKRLPAWLLVCAFFSPVVVLVTGFLMCAGIAELLGLPQRPWTHQTFDVGDGCEVRVIAAPDPGGDTPPSLTCEVWLQGSPLVGAQYVGHLGYDREVRLQALPDYRDRLVVLTAVDQPRVIWFMYDRETGDSWPNSGDLIPRDECGRRILSKVRRLTGDDRYEVKGW